VTLKADIVAADERDGGRRHLLNYGHTLGHAVEVVTDFALRHGEAVAIGTVFAGRLAGRLGRIGTARVTEHLEVVAGYGLPTTLPPGLDMAALLALMRKDKEGNRRPDLRPGRTTRRRAGGRRPGTPRPRALGSMT
jgi:5-deoxy-5-amino-3-dehydroquinate synthase